MMRSIVLGVGLTMIVPGCGDDGGSTGSGGSTSQTGSGGQGGAAATTSTGGGGGTSGSGGQGGAGTGGGMQGVSSLRGQIVVLQGHTNSVLSYNASASFFDWTGADCQSTAQGPCEDLSCFVPTGTTLSSMGAAAGTVSITGGIASLSLMPGGNNLYNQNDNMNLYFAGGDAVTLGASGATVPAFTSTLTAPDGVTLTSDFSSLSAIPRSSPMVVTWSSGPTEGDLEIQLAAVTVDGSGTTIHSMRCDFDITAGTATVPSSALQLLPAGSGNIAILSNAEEVQTVGEWTVKTQLQEFADPGGGQSAGQAVTFQ